MDYFQFKAQQMLLQKKEDCEWQNFCKQMASECAACLAERADFKESKDIGIQASPKKRTNENREVTFESKQRDKQIPNALNSIRSRLEKIDITLSKMYDVSSEDEKKKSKTVSLFDGENKLTSFEVERRKLFIQNSLKASLRKLQSTSSETRKIPPPVIKMKNSGYFIPHELQVKRAAARKAYLSSLETKPKISFQNVKKNAPKNQNKKIVLKKNFKPKKIIKKQVKEEVKTVVTETDEVKDENIENVVDGILEDVLKEAAIDLNRIKERKSGLNSLNNVGPMEKTKETSVPLISSIPSIVPKVTENDDKSGIKLFLCSSKKLEQKNEELKKVLIDDSINTFPTATANILKKTNSDTNQCEKNSERETQPKFVCEISHVLTMDAKSTKDIAQSKDNFFKYLDKISRRVKGNFNPWVLNEMLAESILDECIEDVAKELSEMPFKVVRDIYNREFITVIE